MLVGLVVLAGLGWLWFRDSSFVAVKRVRITGVSGPNVHQIERALRNAALSMSTLDVNLRQLRTAVAPFPDVRTLTVRTQFPHGVVIAVHEQVPIAAVTVDGRTIAVSGDGTLLQAPARVARLPVIPLRVLPGGSSLTEPGARAALSVLAAAPYGLLGHIANATRTQSGVVVQLRRGPQLRFGPPTELAAKWSSALAVLGNSGSHGAAYIDVSDPRRPAAGVQTRSVSASATSSASPRAGQSTASASASATPPPSATTITTSSGG